MNEILTIVISAYNRPKSLGRLLTSLNQAAYSNQKVNLIISIDFSGSNEIFEIADSFEWIFGDKKIINHQTNLGLKQHILFCGDLTYEFGNIVLLEDDIYVSPFYLSYCYESISYFGNNSKIAGISLYNHIYNETAKLPFEAAKLDGYDNYFMQLPSSWGQIWTKNQWKEFKEWLKEYPDEFNFEVLPENIKNWPKSSWKKLYSLYLIETNKYFVYPFYSLSTNFGDLGINFWKKNTQYQSNLLLFDKKYSFVDIKSSLSVYDAYCENIKIGKLLNDKIKNICVDFYGSKNSNYLNFDFILTLKDLNLELVESYGLDLKPWEANIHQKIEGPSIKIYKNSKPIRNTKKYNLDYRRELMNYYYSGLNLQKIITYLGSNDIYVDLMKKAFKKIKN